MVLFSLRKLFLSYRIPLDIRENKQHEGPIINISQSLTGTLPETNIAPKNDGFPIGISFSRGLFSGAKILVSGRVDTSETL